MKKAILITIVNFFSICSYSQEHIKFINGATFGKPTTEFVKGLCNIRNILILFLLCFSLSSSAQVISISSYSKRVYNNKGNNDVWSDYRTTSVLNFYNAKKWEIITDGKKYVYYIINQETYNDGWGTNARFVCRGENGYRYDIDLHWLLDRYIFEITSPWRKVLYYISKEEFNNARNAYLE